MVNITIISILFIINLIQINTQCNTKTNVTNQYDCLYNITMPNDFQYTNVTSSYNKDLTYNTTDECCYYHSNNTQTQPSYCKEDSIFNNNTVINGTNYTTYTEVCIPYNQTIIEAENLANYNKPLDPCGVDEVIEHYKDCYSHGNSSLYCCHMGGSVLGANINQCYYFNTTIGRPGKYEFNDITIRCNSRYISIYSMLIFIILIVLFM